MLERNETTFGEYSAYLSIGQGRRTRNEDSVLFVKMSDRDHFASFDGLGGHGGGDLASRTAAQTLGNGLIVGHSLRESVEMAGPVLEYEYNVQTSAADEGFGNTRPSASMGVCVVACEVSSVERDGAGERAQFAHVGDCRAIVIRDGQVVFATKDHTVTQAKIDLGLIQPESAMFDGDRHVVTRCLLLDEGRDVSSFPETSEFELQEGDIILLASDGLWDNFESDRVAKMVGGMTNTYQMVDKLQSAVARNVDTAGGKDDNLSIIAYRHGKNIG
jgi:protein phosphatase